VDLPGLIEGATEDAGGGKRLIGIVKNTDGILFMVDLTKDSSKAQKVYNELIKAEINKPIIFIGSKIDSLQAKENLIKIKKKFKEILPLSAITEEGFQELKNEIWGKSNLIRIYTDDSTEPMILDKDSSVQDLINHIHKDLQEEFKEAIIDGPSAKFPNQRVGLSHILQDEDQVKVVTE
jgi:uncharacterized protein